MKRTAVAAVLAGLVATAAACHSEKEPNPNPTSTPSGTTTQSSTSGNAAQDVTLTGCLVQGSTSTVYVLENARVGDDKSSNPEMYVVIADSSAGLDLANQINHEVRVTGSKENKAQPTASTTGQKPPEKDLPKLTAKSIASIADRCTSPKAR